MRVGLESFRGGVRRLKLSLRLMGLTLRVRLVGLTLPSRLTGLAFLLVGLLLPLLLTGLVLRLLPPRLTGLPLILAVTVKSSSSRFINPNSASESDSGKGESEGTVENDMAPGER